MNDNVAISVRDVSKKYKLFSSAKDRLKEALHPLRKSYHRDFWALDGISFDVSKGQTLGILGRNGSGKSTLLQIITGVLRPASGHVTVNGRVSALLELGAGFNPEFTGHENVLLNGSIMGIPREEMLDRMPAIQAFADVGEFFHQPVKIYSSGMFVRVAFASAINVDPDILIVDEALAVGDAKFQHKCFDRFAEFQRRGKTIIFVSHNVSLVGNHCDRVLLLDNGKLIANGEPHKVVDLYMDLLFGNDKSRIHESAKETIASDLPQIESSQDRCSQFLLMGMDGDACPSRMGYNPNETRIGGRSSEIIDYLIEAGGLADNNVLRADSWVKLLIKVRFHHDLANPVIGFAIKTMDGIEIYGTNTCMLGINIRKALAGEVRVFQFSFQVQLMPGDYFLDLGTAVIDGTPGGSVIDVRRSIVHVAVVSDRVSFNGLINLAPIFVDLSDAESRNAEIMVSDGSAA
jgi:ABC-type polysaccharide/polyol phosphate transport system ATPase subunit